MSICPPIFVDSQSTHFFLNEYHWDANSIVLSVTKNINSNDKTKPQGRYHFSGWPLSSVSIECALTAISPTSAIALRICRDGERNWEYFDVHLQRNKKSQLTPSFKFTHDGFRLEILDHSNIEVGEKIEIKLSLHPLNIKITSDLFKTNANNGFYEKTPRIIIVDPTPMGHDSATGQIKSLFFEKWHPDSILQIWTDGQDHQALHVLKAGADIKTSKRKTLKSNEVISAVNEFNPDLIYFRPIDNAMHFDIVDKILEQTSASLMTHIMDDWQSRLIYDAKDELHKKLDLKLRSHLEKSKRNLSICEEMSDAFKARYGVEWIHLANGVNISEFRQKNWQGRPPLDTQNPFRFRYMGGLADDMNFDSICDLAFAISDLGKHHHLCLEIFTMPWYLEKARSKFSKLKNVFVYPIVEKEKYNQTISEADALVIAYNYDSKSQAYIGLSMANKLPECLATGVPLFAYGPATVATISRIKSLACSKVISKKDSSELKQAILTLILDFDKCKKLGELGIKVAKEKFQKEHIQSQFLHYSIQSSTQCSFNNDGNLLNSHEALRKLRPLQEFLPTICTAKVTRELKLNQNQWIFPFGQSISTAGKLFFAEAFVLINSAGKVRITLARHANTAYEGSAVTLNVEKDRPTSFFLECAFKGQHSELKLQIEFLDELPNHSAEITIMDFYIIEAPKSLSPSTTTKNNSFKDANLLLRKGQYAEALPIYLNLYAATKASFYMQNLLYAAHKLNLPVFKRKDFVNKLFSLN